jgi:CBS domain-containing protein
MAKIKVAEAGGLTVEAVMHTQLSVVPAAATVADVRDYFAASTHRRLAVLVDDDGVYVGALTSAHLTGADPTRPAAELADREPIVSPATPAEIGRDLALETDARRIPVIDDDGRLVGVLAVTTDLQRFCGTTAPE